MANDAMPANRTIIAMQTIRNGRAENAFVLQYHMTPDITPYIEYDYLDRQGVYNGRDNLSEKQLSHWCVI